MGSTLRSSRGEGGSQGSWAVLVLGVCIDYLLKILACQDGVCGAGVGGSAVAVTWDAHFPGFQCGLCFRLRLQSDAHPYSRVIAQVLGCLPPMEEVSLVVQAPDFGYAQPQRCCRHF